MAWNIILPIAASIIQGGIGNALAANSASQENNRQRLVSQARRAELQPIIDRLQEARDYFGVEEQFTRDFSRASEQMAAQSAQSGMTDAGRGGLDQVRADQLGAGLASLAQFKTQDEAQRQNLLAQILSDPSLFGGVVPEENTGLQTFLGGLGGAAAGAGSVLNSFISTPEGMAALGSLFGQGGPTTQNVVDNGSVMGTPMFGDALISQARSGMNAQAAAPASSRNLQLAGQRQGGGSNTVSYGYSPDVYRPSRGNPYYTR